jgi:hypothetical protein
VVGELALSCGLRVRRGAVSLPCDHAPRGEARQAVLLVQNRGMMEEGEIQPPAAASDGITATDGRMIVTPGGAGVGGSISATSRFDEAWFADAQREAVEGPLGDFHARRREIVFSVICAESYIVEWAVDQLMESGRGVARSLGQTHDLLPPYFPRNRSLFDQWQEVPQELVRDGYLEPFAVVEPMPPFADFRRLIEMRHDVTHANVSRLELHTGSEETSRVLRTTTTQLAQLAPRWATRIVAERIQELHRLVGTPPPPWAQVPDEDPATN